MYVPNYLNKNYSDVIEKKVGDYTNTQLNIQANKCSDFEIYYIGEGNKTLFKNFYITENNDDTISIIAKTTNELINLFDNRTNGYSNSFKKHSEVQSVKGYKKMKCPKCANENFNISMFLEYQNEEILKEEDEGIYDYSNTFQWIKIYTKCCKCGKKLEILNYED